MPKYDDSFDSIFSRLSFLVLVFEIVFFSLFKFLTNFYNLIRNDFDPRHNNCKKKYKSQLLEFYLKEIDN